jgi:hypothetical protein
MKKRKIEVKSNYKKKKRKPLFIWFIRLALSLSLLFSAGFGGYQLFNNVFNSNSSSSLVQDSKLELESIVVERLPYKTSFSQFDRITTAGGKLRLVFNDGTSSIIDMNDNMLRPVSLINLALGTNEVVLEYKLNDNMFITSFTISVNALDSLIDDFELTNQDLNLVVGQSLKLDYRFSPFNSIPNNVTFRSSDETIATIDELGNINALRSGQVIITVSIDGVTKEFEVNVNVPSEITISLLRNTLVTIEDRFNLINKESFRPEEYELFFENYQNLIQLLNSTIKLEDFNLILKEIEDEFNDLIIKSITLPGSIPLVDITPPTVNNPTVEFDFDQSFTSQVTLNWSAATDSNPIKYYIYQSLVEITDLDDLNSATLLNENGTSQVSYLVTGLNPATTYYFVVVAQDPSGNKTLYSSVEITTLSPSITISSLVGGPLVAKVEPSGALSYPLSSLFIPDNEAVTITWYTSSSAVTESSAPAGVSISASNIISNAATLTLNITAANTIAGNYYFKAAADGVSSSVVTLNILSKTVSVGTISGGPIVAETAISGVTYPITTQYIGDNQAVSITWFTTSGATQSTTAPAGISITGSNTTSNSSTLTVSVDQTAPTVAGNYYFKVNIDEVSSSVVTLTIVSKSVTLSALSGGPIIVGQPNTGASYAITTQYIADGQEVSVAWYDSSSGENVTTAPAGIVISNQNILNNSATLSVSVDQNTIVEGTYYLKASVSGVSSVVRSLVITGKTVTIGDILNGNIFVGESSDNRRYNVTTQYIANGQAATVTWYDAAEGGASTSAPAGISIVPRSTVLSNSLILDVTVVGAENVAGTYYFSATISGKESERKALNVLFDVNTRALSFNANKPETIISITSIEDLNKIRNHAANSIITFNGIPYFFNITNEATYAHYILSNDITLSLVEEERVDWVPLPLFRGTFNGNNKTISNLYINKSSGIDNNSGVSLFSETTYSSVIKNLNLANISYTVTQSTGVHYLAGLVGKASGSLIINNTISGSINGSSWTAGLVGEIYEADIFQNHTNVAISGKEKVGGLISFAIASNIEQNSSIGNVSATLEMVGGLIGQTYQKSSSNFYNIIRNNYSLSDVVGSDYVGGLIGYIDIMSTQILSYNYAVGSVSLLNANIPDPKIGGLIGFNSGRLQVSPDYVDWDIISSYYLSDNSDTDSSDDRLYGTAYVLADLKDQSKLIDWDFNQIWKIDATNNGLPYLDVNVLRTNLNLEFDPQNYTGSGNLLDTSINSNDGTIIGATFDSSNKTFIFDGTDDTISIPDNDALEPGSGSFSIEAWIFPRSSTGSQVIAVKTDGGNSSEIGYGIRFNNGVLIFEVGDGTTAQQLTHTPLALNHWYHVVGSYDMSGQFKIYVNGNEVASSARPYQTIRTTSSPLYIGSYLNTEFGQFFNGRIGDVRFYKRALSATEVYNNFYVRVSLY